MFFRAAVSAILFLNISSGALAASEQPYNYGWLFKNTGDQIVEHPKFDGLLRHIVPVAKTRKGYETLSELISGNVTVAAEGNGKQIVEKRYVIIHGFTPHAAFNQGLIWIDTKEDKSIIALATPRPGADSDKEMVCFISKSFLDQKQFPPAFTSAYAQWIKSSEIKPSKTSLNNYRLLYSY
jgi:hypothetical protein